LTTGPDTFSKVNKKGLPPYMIYDLQNSKEVGEENFGEIYNPQEAEFVVKICQVLTRLHRNLNIGVITPYQKQVAHLKKIFGNLIPSLEINTVDSYQGREKDIIIFSSVRAKNSAGKIGFLDNRQRLNVSLTRAKSALYIVCHADSLKNGSEDWKSCIKDAKKRNLIVKV
jgi:senataxin